MAQKATRAAKQRSSRSSIATALASQRIVVPQPPAVRSYLASHRDLAKILPLVCERARREFGQEVELTLKVYRDPEINDRYLTLYVRLAAYDDTTISRMDGVTQDFDEELCSVSGYLLLTTDFRPPQVSCANS